MGYNILSGGNVKYIVFFLFGIWGASCVQAGDYVKYMRQVYGVEAGTDCLMDFKFGQIVLRQWEKDSILVEASFRVKGVEDWEKEALAEYLDFRLASWSGVWKLYLEVASGFGREGDLVAEMQVWVPRKITLDLVNRFGNIRLPDYDAQLPLSLTAVYGNIEVDTVRSLPEVEVCFNVSYGKLEVRNCEKANVRSAYSSVGVKLARFLQIKAEKSYLVLRNTDTIVSQGEYNNYDIR